MVYDFSSTPPNDVWTYDGIGEPTEMCGTDVDNDRDGLAGCEDPDFSCPGDCTPWLAICVVTNRHA